MCNKNTTKITRGNVPQMNEDKIVCYGKFNECDKCFHCELKSPCRNRTDEQKENLRYHFQHVSIPQIFFDDNEDTALSQEVKEAVAECSEKEIETETDTPLVLKDIVISPEAKDVVLEVVRRLADFYFHTPHVFEAIMKNSFQGKSQSDIAREKFITRQCENKRLLKDLGIAQKRNDIQARRDRELAEAKAEYTQKCEDLRQKDEFLCTLSDRDWRIYKLHFIDGCSEISTANQVGCSRRTVSTVAQFLRSKLNENCTIVKRGRKKKCQK